MLSKQALIRTDATNNEASSLQRPISVNDVATLWRNQFAERKCPFITRDREGRKCFGPIFSTPSNPLARDGLRLLINRLPKVHSFLDVGCGRGNILYLAAQMKDENPSLTVHGIERKVMVAKEASQFGTVHVMDAFRFQNYAAYDLIFTYRPLVEYRDQLALEERIINAMAPGASFISAMPAHHLLTGENGRPRGIYTKKS